ncbi:MAG: hypothetical protein D6719_04280 [Candidatus Dadabacteria bacterium]|nr:MAG: hypothetical protein D6719_04280 [Candidatus Dadabacteria bacterium]
MSYYCFKCGAKLELATEGKVSRRDSCDSCSSDLHVCYNCKFYDSSSYNECREPQAERVLEKDRANFCDYFVFREGRSTNTQAAEREKAKKALDDLFK